MNKYSLKEDQRPADLWFWDDWFSSFDVRACSLAARGLWIDMLGIMSRSTAKGTLTINGRKIDSEELARLEGADPIEVVALLVELERNKVFSRFLDGTIYNRRMCGDRELSQKRSAAGLLGVEARKQKRFACKQNYKNIDSKALAKNGSKIEAKPNGNPTPDNEAESIDNIGSKIEANISIKPLSKIIKKASAKGGLEDLRGTSSLNLKSFLEIDIRLTQLLIDLMQKNNPESTIIKKLTPDRQKRWIDECRLLRESDGKTERDIELIIRFSQSDQFWKVNILSMSKLREKWDQLWLKAQKPDATDGVRQWLKEREGEDVV